MHKQYITNDRGKKVAVILPMEDYNKILDELDELKTVKAYDKAKSSKQEFIPAKEMFREVEKKRKKS